MNTKGILYKPNIEKAKCLSSFSYLFEKKEMLS